MNSKSPKKKLARPKRILRLPDLDHAKVAVLNTFELARLSTLLPVRHRRFHRLVLLRAPTGFQ